MPERKRLLFRQLLRFTHAFVRTDPQVVPTPIDRPSASRLATPSTSTATGYSSCNAGDDCKRRDHAVIGAVNEIANVVLLDYPMRSAVRRAESGGYAGASRANIG